jgi:two-component sensor histidine kinase
MENSLGMELIHLLSNQINATIEIKQKSGFEFEISFSA